MESAKVSDETNKGNLQFKTMEAFLMLEADTAATLQRENGDPQEFLLLLGNVVRKYRKIYSGSPLIRTLRGHAKVPVLSGCPD